MTPRLVFRPQAEAELLDARDWYETERVGLGAVFTAALEATVGAILENPLAYPRVKGDTRRALVRRFPYAVYFHPTGDEIIVLAVIHGRGIHGIGALAAESSFRLERTGYAAS